MVFVMFLQQNKLTEAPKRRTSNYYSFKECEFYTYLNLLHIRKCNLHILVLLNSCVQLHDIIYLPIY